MENVGMMELEDMLGLDSSDFKVVGVQVPLPIVFYLWHVLCKYMSQVNRISHLEGLEPS